MWIQLWSPVTSANSLIASWVTSCHSETPTSSPSWALRSSNPFTVSMRASLLELGVGEDGGKGAEGEHRAADGEPGHPPRAHARELAAVERPLDLVLASPRDEEQRDREPGRTGTQHHVGNARAADQCGDDSAHADRGRDRGDARAPPGQP